jgi:hypothetical protein
LGIEDLLRYLIITGNESCRPPYPLPDNYISMLYKSDSIKWLLEEENVVTLMPAWYIT